MKYFELKSDCSCPNIPDPIIFLSPPVRRRSLALNSRLSRRTIVALVSESEKNLIEGLIFRTTKTEFFEGGYQGKVL